MNRQTLALFINKILLNSENQNKAISVLNELKDLLYLQGNNEMAKLVEKTVSSLPEIQTSAKHGGFDWDKLNVDYRRAEERRRREQMAREYSRC